MNTIRRFKTITLHPHWGQYIISHGYTFLLVAMLLLGAGWEENPLKELSLACACILGLFLLYGCLYLKTLRFIISSEQLIVEHGVFQRSSDYIELYRVVDFAENRNILEQFFGLKTISIFSGDRTNPRLDIFGVREQVDVVGIVRERVEYNRQIKHIYEVTNR